MFSAEQSGRGQSPRPRAAWGRATRTFQGRFAAKRRADLSARRPLAVGEISASFVNEWLQNLEPSEELTEFGATNLKTVITEALNNAERHGRIGGDGHWTTAGFMAKREHPHHGPSVPVHVCHIGLMNVGRPISEAIREAPQRILEQLDRYVKLHARCGMSESTLATVFALQDGISRVKQTVNGPSGGTGMMDIVEFANGVGVPHGDGLDTRVAIVSGSSYVRFSGAYRQGRPDESDRRLQWFNTENDVKEPPDSSNVMDLPCAFPGTLVTMRFVIDQNHEEETDD